MSGSSLLSGLLALPVIGAIFIFLLPGETEATKRNARWIALFATLVAFASSSSATGSRTPFLTSSGWTASRCRSFC